MVNLGPFWDPLRGSTLRLFMVMLWSFCGHFGTVLDHRGHFWDPFWSLRTILGHVEHVWDHFDIVTGLSGNFRYHLGAILV